MAFHHHPLAVRKMLMAKAKKKKVAKLGTGKRFAALVSTLERRRVGKTARGRALARALPGKTGKVRTPGALAAFIGRKKFGKARFQKLAAAGRRRKV